MKIENISDGEDKPLSKIKLSRMNLYTHIEGHRCLDHFQSRVASFTFLSWDKITRKPKSNQAKLTNHLWQQPGVTKNQNFIFELELEDDKSIKLDFWTDARIMAVCKYFKDVISFDTTCNTNRYYVVLVYDVELMLFYKSATENDFLMKYGHVDNKWRCKLHVFFVEHYEDRHIWIPIYLDHHFWARMRSTQRSEIMHAFFNKFITWNSSLI
ncbi:hypothetical protein Ahy_A09g042166 [Arachis hypogaea]|uniref:Protein FAR1-RELATED SEQUENCE n=1 Tax=Arachis hypogaea TaxID=3818 RepID=A0A445BF16_ARAHY|nr:hypothetical protein Ahy_A09g042166 [Arachis hypogaea]